MSQADLITGLDVGTTKVCAVVAEIVPDSWPNVIGVGISPCDGLKKGVVVDLEATTNAIRDAVSKAERMSGEEINSVAVGITGEHIACLNSRSVIAITNPGREINTEDVKRLQESAAIIVLPPDREIIHSIPRWYSVDGQQGVKFPVGMHGNRLEVETHIVTGLSSFLENVVKCVDQAELSVTGTALEAIATGESVLLPAEKDLGIALVDIGGGTSDVAIYVDGEIYYSGVIPVGGNHVTRDIAVGLRCAIDEAERVKMESGCALAHLVEGQGAFSVKSLSEENPRQFPRKVLAEIIEARMAELCNMILDQIHSAGCEDKLPAGLVFTGGGAQIEGLSELATEVTGMAARIGRPYGVTGLVDAVSSPKCSTAVGLVLFWSRNNAKNNQDYKGNNIVSSILRRIKELFAKFSEE